MRFRWFELGRVDKGASIAGLAVGGIGTLSWAIFLAGLSSSQGGSSSDISAFELFTIIMIIFLVPFLSALALLILPLKNEQRGVLGFTSLIGAICAMIPASFLLLVMYCSAIHSTCS